MEFLLYLSTQSMDIYKMISKKIGVVENSEICRRYDVFGFYDPSKNQMHICTERIKDFGNTTFYINQTLTHESVHYAQSCRERRKIWFPFLSSQFSSLGLSESTIKLSSEKQNWLEKSISHNPSYRQIEREAFWLEDSPITVKSYVQKFCF